jgi:hypothetical protein
MLNALARLNAQGQAARRNLAMRGEQAQRAAQANLSGVQGAAAAATDQRRRYFEKNLEDLDTARRQQISQFAMSPFTGAMSGMRYGNSGSKAVYAPDDAWMYDNSGEYHRWR